MMIIDRLYFMPALCHAAPGRVDGVSGAMAPDGAAARTFLRALFCCPTFSTAAQRRR
jgi:hypothetical protein